MLEKIIKESDPSKVFEGSANASFGELLQGVGSDNDDFLVTFPVDLHTKAFLVQDDAATELNVLPAYKSKVKKFVDKLCAEYKLSPSGTLIVISDIPEGKGLSSSTADMVAASRALSRFAGVDFDPEQVGRILRTIEPSDGVLYEGSVAYKHKVCSLVRKMGMFPKTTIIAIDEGGVLDTISYNKVVKDYSVEDKMMYSLLQTELAKAFAAQDLERIGFVATQSALMNQKYNNKKNLLNAIGLLEEISALGVITTHSGTFIGLLLCPGHTDVDGVFNKIQEKFPLDNVVRYDTL